MINYIEFLGLPEKIAIFIITGFLVMQIIGEILEFKGKVVPEIMKIRKYFARRSKERKTLLSLSSTIQSVNALLNDVGSHYSEDNITKRNDWIKSVNERLEQNENQSKVLESKIDKNNEVILDLLIESKRNAIISFANRIVDEKLPVTREQFNRFFKMYDDYEKTIEENNLTNGEVDIAHRLATEAYEEHMRNHSFIEDVRGY